MEQFVRSTRKRLDSIILLIGTDIPVNREVALVKTNLQEGSMFLGLLLGALGAINPYPESHNHKSAVIEDRADQADAPFVFPENGMTQTGKIKFLRSELQTILDQGKKELSQHVDNVLMPQLLSAEGTDANLNDMEGRMYTFAHEAEVSITKAKLWLGMQLNNIHQELQDAGVANRV